MTDLIVGGIPPAARLSRLTVLGAGNCNDLDLACLRQHFDAIQLVDCDLEAMQQGIQRQRLTVDPSITLMDPVDLSGIADQIQAWSPDRPPSAPEIDVTLAAASAVTLTPFPPADVVASVCLLSQILERFILEIGPEHPRLLELVQQVRHAHLRLLIDQLNPSGTGLLITGPCLVGIRAANC